MRAPIDTGVYKGGARAEGHRHLKGVCTPKDTGVYKGRAWTCWVHIVETWKHIGLQNGAPPTWKHIDTADVETYANPLIPSRVETWKHS